MVDDHLASRMQEVRRDLHAGRKLDRPVLVADRPWEGEPVYVYGTVDDDPEQGLFKMWHLSRLGPGQDSHLSGLERHGDIVLQATTTDSIRWD